MAPIYQANEDHMLAGDMDYDYTFANRWTSPEIEPDSTSMYDEPTPGKNWEEMEEKPKTYTVLESSMSSQSSGVFSSSDMSSSDDSNSIPSTVLQYMQSQESLDYWRYKHPQRWTKTEVMGFLHFFGELAGFDIRNFYGERFQDVSGAELCAMTKEELMQREPNYGHDIYSFLRRMASDLVVKTPSTTYLNESGPMFGLPATNDDELYETDFSWKAGQDTADFDDQLETLDVKIGSHTYSLNPNPKSIENLPLVMPAVSSSHLHYQMPNLHDSFDAGYDSHYGSYSQQQPMHSYYQSSPRSPMDSKVRVKVEVDIGKSRRVPMKPRRPQKPRTHKHSLHSSSSDESSDGEVEIKRPSKRGKGNRLWEFIASLLKNSQHNPRIIKWEDKPNGIFRIVQSQTVADMWGGKKNNEHMTYEKLSRALRFSRSAGYFADVPKDGRYPKKLCFKFGNRAVIDF